MLSENAQRMIETIKKYGKDGMPVHGKFGKEQEDELVNAGVAFYVDFERGKFDSGRYIQLNPMNNQPAPAVELSLADILFWDDVDQPTERTPEKEAEMARLEAKAAAEKAENQKTVEAILAKNVEDVTYSEMQQLVNLGVAEYDYFAPADGEGELLPIRLKVGYHFAMDTDLWASGD